MSHRLWACANAPILEGTLDGTCSQMGLLSRGVFKGKWNK